MDSQWLKAQLRANPEKSKAELAKALGVVPPAISKILNGTRQIKAQEYISMRIFFGLPTDGDRAVSAPAPRGSHKKLLTVSLSERHETVTDDAWIIPPEILSTRINAPPDKIRVFAVNENLMEPDFREGESVLVDISDQMPSPSGVFVISDGYGHMLRHCAIVPGAELASVVVSTNVRSFAPQKLDINDFSIIGRVIAKLQMV
jgi:hypothetical protein